MFKLKSKKIYDMTIDELKKKSSKYKSIFYAYLVMMLVIGAISGTLTLQSMDGINKNQETLGITNYLLLLNSILIAVTIFFLIFLWFVNESSYYKMLEQFSDLMIYLKQREK